MTTKLDAMVAHLAGRGVDDPFLNDLDDPESEVSRFLEATRARSKALIGSPEPVSPVALPRPGRFRTQLAVGVAGLVIVACATWLVDARLRGVEAVLGRSRSEAEDQSRRIEAALTQLGSRPDPPPIEPLERAIGRVESGLTKLEKRPDGLGVVNEVREALATLRRDVATESKNQARRDEEAQASIHELNRLLRLLLKQNDPAATVTDPPSNFPTPRPPADRVMPRP